MKVKLLNCTDDVLGDCGEFIRGKGVQMFLAPSIIGFNLLIKEKGKGPWISPFDNVAMMYNETMQEFWILGVGSAKKIFEVLKES